MGRVIVLCFLQPPGLARVRRALTPANQVLSVATWESLLARLNTNEFDVAIVDPCAGGDQRVSSRLSALAAAAQRPLIPIIGYVAVTASAMRAVESLVRLGAAAIVIRGVDDSSESLCATVHQSIASGAAGQLVRALEPQFERLPPTVAAAIRQAFDHPVQIHSVADLAAAARTTRRSLDRWLARAGMSPARTLLTCARVNAAFHLLSSRTVPLREVASSLGYTSPRSLAREVLAITGYSVSQTQGMSRDALVLTILQHLSRTVGESTRTSY